MEEKNKNISINKNVLIACVIIIVIIFGIGIYALSNKKTEYKEETKPTENITKVEDKGNGNISQEETKKEKIITNTDKVTIEENCEFNVVSHNFTKDIMPPNPDSWYHHIESKSDTQIYSNLIIDIKNLQGNARKQDSIMSVKLKYDDKYEYTCQTVTEEKGGGDLETYTNLYNIDPLSTMKYHFVVEVPLEIKDSDKTLKAIITVGSQEYVYQIK